jgi:transcriptional regulator with XRE-family HTH domain
MLAGISVEYYLRLERGRAYNPSPQILEALARRCDWTAMPHSICAIWPAQPDRIPPTRKQELTP